MNPRWTLARCLLAAFACTLGCVDDEAAKADASPSDVASTDVERLDAPPGDVATPDVPRDLVLTDCTAIGCVDTISAQGLATLAGPDMLQLDVHLCRNDVCADGTPAMLPTSPGLGLGCGLMGPGTDLVRCAVFGLEDGRFRLDVAFPERGALTDGDRYVVRVTHRPTGTVVAESSLTARYTVTYPNGPACGPACHRAMLAITTRPLPAGDGGAADAR